MNTVVLEALERIHRQISFQLPEGASGAIIEKILNDTVLTGGKRLRPLLLILFGNALGLSFEELSPYARAAELCHAATLAHDDVIDEAKQRRSRQTLNSVSSNTHAILGGDFLLARVIAEISRLGELAVIQDMAQVLEELVSGEWHQLEAHGVVHSDFDRLAKVAELKTASLFAWCCSTPARLARTSDTTVDRARLFGQQVGIAFQQIDDLLDFEEGTGKAVAQDFKEGLMNHVACELLRRSPDRRHAFALSLGRPDLTLPWNEAELQGAMQAVRAQATERLARAEALLGELVADAKQGGAQVNEAAVQGLLQILHAIPQRGH